MFPNINSYLLSIEDICYLKKMTMMYLETNSCCCFFQVVNTDIYNDFLFRIDMMNISKGLYIQYINKIFAIFRR